MWPGPYGEWGSRKYLLASLDQSLARMGLDYVDIFYSHRFDPDTPLEETMGALDTAVRSGKALVRRHLVVLRRSAPARRRRILRDLGTPLLIHQPSYSMLNRWVEDGPCSTCSRRRASAASRSRRWRRACSPTATSTASPSDSRAAQGKSLDPELLSEPTSPTSGRSTRSPRTAASRSRSWRWPGCCATARVTSVLIGASSVAPARRQPRRRSTGPPLTDDELAEIDQHAVDAGINLWAQSSAG